MQSTKRDAKDFEIPLILIAIGLSLYAIHGLRMAGALGPAMMLAKVFIGAAIGTALMIGAAFITAGLIGVSFGELWLAWLKLTAIYIFPASMIGVFPLSILVALFTWFSLILWLFELEIFQAIIFVTILIAVNLLVGMMLQGLFG